MSDRDSLTIDIFVFLVCIAAMIFFGGCAPYSHIKPYQGGHVKPLVCHNCHYD